MDTDTPSSDGDHEAEEDSPLVERLRKLEWPPVDPEIRQRAWQRFQELMPDLKQQADAHETGETEQTAATEHKPPSSADDAER